MAPCVYDCVSARYVEKTGFKAMCLSGGELAASLCGFPDIGLVTLDELVGAVDRISSCTDIPMIVDIDTGFGNEINLIRTCKRVAQAGAKAVHLEDQTFPKRCGHLAGKEVIPRKDYISKIKAAHHVLKNTDFSRFSGRVNVDQTITDWIKAGATMYAHREQSKFQAYSGNLVNSNVLYSIMTYDPTVKPFNEDGTYGRPPGGRGDNPLANLMERQNDETNDKFNGTAFVEVTPLEGLTGKASVGVEILHKFQGTYLPKSTYQGGIDGGVASTYDFTGTRQVFEGTINYMKTFNKVHDFNAMVGYTYEKYQSEYRRENAKGFSTDLFSYNNMGAAATVTNIASNKTENILVSFFGRVNYTYNNKYLATVTVRRDGSSRFGANEHWGTFPSGSLAWRASEEDFIKNLNLFSNLKVRAGFGVTGNERIGDYASYALMANTRYTFDGSTNSAGVHMNQSSAANPNLKWETTKQWNVGVDMGFLDNRISVTLDGYWKKTDDLLLAVKLPMYTGFTSGQSNIGSIQNRGFELDFTSHNLTGDFIWDTKFNFSLNRNKVLDLGDNGDIYIRSSKPMGSVSEEDFAIVREGERLGSIFGYKYIGVLQQGETYAPQPNSKPGDPKFEDVNKDGMQIQTSSLV